MFSATIIILVAALLSAGASNFLLYHVHSKAQADGNVTEILTGERDKKVEIVEKLRGLYRDMVDTGTCKQKIGEIQALQETIKAERGRITITQAELETVETRLRELEEIERELGASVLETKEELTILEKKQKELTGKNDALKKKIADSAAQWDQLLKEVETNAQVAEKVQAAKTELVLTEEKIAVLLLQIEQGNEQYFILKRRYDALDIEYAQLYEKFSEAEAMVNASKDKEKKE